MTTMTSMRFTKEDTRKLEEIRKTYQLRNRTEVVQFMARWFAENWPIMTIGPQHYPANDQKRIPKKSRKAT